MAKNNDYCELFLDSFAASGDVQRHIVIHTGQRPHLCDVCGRGKWSFSQCFQTFEQ